MSKGKSAERACEFSTALKYYFAGNMYFDRLRQKTSISTPVTKGEESKERRDLLSLREEFKNLYVALLPMTNSQVIGVGMGIMVVVVVVVVMMIIMRIFLLLFG